MNKYSTLRQNLKLSFQALVNLLILIMLITVQGLININLHNKTQDQIKQLQEPPREALVENVQYLTPSSSPKLDEDGNVIEVEFVDELKQVLVPVFRGYKEKDNGFRTN